MAGPVATAADEAQRNILAIGAQQGDAGVKAFNDALSSIDQVQADALTRGGLQASGIAAPTTAAGEMAQLYLRPGATAKQLTESAKASFQAGVARNYYGTANYLNQIKSIEPMLDKYIAAQAAGSGGGGSGGGGSGGGGGGGSDLSDSELRVQLKGAADQARGSDIADAAARLKAAGDARAAARANVKAALSGRKQTVKVAQVRAKKLTKVGRQVQGKKPNRQQRRTLIRGRNQVFGDLMSAARATSVEGHARGVSQKAARSQRQAYGEVVATANAPLGDYARAIGVEAGEDPNRVYGLIGPTEEKSLALADADRNKRAGGSLGMFGRQPTLGPRAAAKDIKVSPEKVKGMRKSANYRTLAASVEQALASGTPLAEVSRGLDSWRQPVARLYTKGARKGQKVKRGGKVVYDTPSHAHLVDLVLSDYAPAFDR